MTIKHLVISGGGPIYVKYLGVIQHLEENKYLDRNDIQTIYCTSAGSFVAVLLCLKYDWQTINDYVIKRPWHDVFKVNIHNIMDAYSKKGLYDRKVIDKCFKPLFYAKDISLDITLEDFYNLTGIELHTFAFELNTYTVKDISYKTFPTLELLSAIQMTCGIPMLVTPVCIDNMCFVDGGLACNYPLNHCIEAGNNPDEILALRNRYGENRTEIKEESTLFDFMLTFLFKAVFSVNKDHIQDPAKNEILIDAGYMSLEYLRNFVKNIDFRNELLLDGIQTAKDFLEKNHLQNSV